MPDIEDGGTVEIQGSAKDPYLLKNTGGVYSCTCPAWRNQSTAIERRTCKHLRSYRGDDAETERLGGELPERVARPRAVTSRTASSATSTESVSAGEPPILLAHPWDTLSDVSGWWMSEKLDGVRAYWDGKQFISRQGNVYMAPDWFIEDLPDDVHLDGELWLGRKMFQKAVSIVRRMDKNDQWKDIKFLVFDAPKLAEPFEARIAFIRQFLDERQTKYAEPHVHTRCESTDHLKEELARVEALGGEGLMLRKPGSKYEVGRSYTLLKVKSFFDADAVVIEHLPGAGRHKGRMGALNVQMADGTKFSVGTGFSDAQRDNPPAVGAIISFRYQELTDAGVPRFPSFLRVRTDIDSLGTDSLPKPASAAKAVAAAAAVRPAVPVQQPVAARAAAVQSIGTVVKAGAASSVASPSAAPPASQSVGTASGVRYFEYVDDKSSKFWSINVVGSSVTVTFGRIGTQGQAKTKSFPSAGAAAKFASDLVDEKVGKGYEEKGGGCTTGDDDEDDFDEDEDE